MTGLTHRVSLLVRSRWHERTCWECRVGRPPLRTMIRWALTGRRVA